MREIMAGDKGTEIESNITKTPKRDIHGPKPNRRDFLKVTAIAAGALALGGCGEAKPTKISPTPEGIREIPTIVKPSATATESPPPKQEIVQLVEFVNTSQDTISKEAADKINSLTASCRSELLPLNPEDKKPYFPELSGLSIQGSEILDLKFGETKLKIGYCNTEMYGETDEQKALSPTLVVYIGEGDKENPIFLPTLDMAPDNLTSTMRKRISEGLRQGESIEFVRLVPVVTPEGKIIWSDSTLGLVVSADGSLHLSQDGKELPANTEKQDGLVPMVVAIRQADGVLRYEITDPVQDRVEEKMVLQAEADGGFAGFEVGQWQNKPNEIWANSYIPVNDVLGRVEYSVLRNENMLIAQSRDLGGDFTVATAEFDQEKKEWVWLPVPFEIAANEMMASNSGSRESNKFGTAQMSNWINAMRNYICDGQDYNVFYRKGVMIGVDYLVQLNQEKKPDLYMTFVPQLSAAGEPITTPLYFPIFKTDQEKILTSEAVKEPYIAYEVGAKEPDLTMNGDVRIVKLRP
jgi:hypothetical protein